MPLGLFPVQSSSTSVDFPMPAAQGGSQSVKQSLATGATTQRETCLADNQNSNSVKAVNEVATWVNTRRLKFGDLRKKTITNGAHLDGFKVSRPLDEAVPAVERHIAIDSCIVITSEVDSMSGSSFCSYHS